MIEGLKLLRQVKVPGVLLKSYLSNYWSNLYQKLMDDASCTNNALSVTFTMPFTVTIVVNVGELCVFNFVNFHPKKCILCFRQLFKTQSMICFYLGGIPTTLHPVRNTQTAKHEDRKPPSAAQVVGHDRSCTERVSEEFAFLLPFVKWQKSHY